MPETELSSQILELRSQGKTYNEIKEELGCSKSTISYHLGSGQKQKTLQRSRDARSKIAKYLQQLKEETPCMDCGENYPYWVMEFDHLGDKLFNISEYRHRVISLDAIKIEVEKCEIVCANCHRDRTHSRSLVTGNWILTK